jgi:hypothetical protein
LWLKVLILIHPPPPPPKYSNNGCEEKIPTWGSRRRNLHEAKIRIFGEGKERVGMQDEKVLVWVKTITRDVI